MSKVCVTRFGARFPYNPRLAKRPGVTVEDLAPKAKAKARPKAEPATKKAKARQEDDGFDVKGVFDAFGDGNDT